MHIGIVKIFMKFYEKRHCKYWAVIKLDGKVFKEVCGPLMRSAGFSSVSSFKTAYSDIFGKYYFSDAKIRMPYSADVVSRMIGGHYTTIKNADRISLALYLVVHGLAETEALFDTSKAPQQQGTGSKPYSSIANVVSNDIEVRRLSELIASKSTDTVKSVDLSGFADRVMFYGLLSSRIEEETEQDGIPPKCVVGYLVIDSSGLAEGQAFIYFDDNKIKKNGKISSVDSIFLNVRGALLIEYTLTRHYLPGSPANRTGFIKVAPYEGRKSIVTGAQVFQGTYKDLDLKGVSIDGSVELEVVDVSAAQAEAELRRYASLFSEVLQQ